MKRFKVGIIDYGVGNLGSIANILNKAGADALLVSCPSKIDSCDKFVLPGVGAFASAMNQLKESPLFESVSALKDKGRPILGICLGMQMLFQESEEGGINNGLGWIEGKIVRFNSLKKFNDKLPIPHMGWSKVMTKGNNPLFNELSDNRFYHVHSYHAVTDEKYIIGESYYGYEFTSAVNKENVFGVQFHPEKSHRYGLQMIKNFVELSW